MRRLIVGLFLASLVLPAFATAQSTAVSRRDGFLLLWQGIRRATQENGEQPFADVSEVARGFSEITYAKHRGIVDEEKSFRPDDSLALDDALLWLFRTRSVDEPLALTRENLPALLKRYPVASLALDNSSKTVTEEELEILARSLDEMLAKEDHEVSMYGEKFHDKGTAFGERFDMNALTAAHRTFPHNTLVKVTNIMNGKSVTVRINDRGPYVEGRDMDLSLAAFIAIEDRSKGVLHATFQRLGDAALVDLCGDKDPRRAVRITKGVHLIGGVPIKLPLGKDVTFRSTRPFVLRSVRYPDGTVAYLEDWILPGESHPFVPGVAGEYTFTLGSADGRARELKMRAIECS